jgi:hypothetical protein
MTVLRAVILTVTCVPGLLSAAAIRVDPPGASDLGPLPPSAQGQAPKKQPSARLIEPWPTDAKMAERRAEAEARPIFQQAEPLAFTLTADIGAVNNDRDPDSTKTFPAELTLADRGGSPSAPIPVSLRTRGRLRLAKCGFPPLSIDFPKKGVAGTVFDGQRKMKVVTHCWNSQAYDQYVQREYLAYKLHNLLTPNSFRARLARITYQDSKNAKVVASRYGFLIEDEDDVAWRMGGRITSLPRLQFADLDQQSLTLMMVFQYMIGNTDFSIHGLHNADIVQTRDKKLHPIVWDFDSSGLVDVPYGKPDPRLELPSVRVRLYRGPCLSLAEFEPALAIFREKEAQAMALIDLPGLDEQNRRSVRNYLAEFFKMAGRPDAVKRAFVDGCRPKSTM